MVLRLSSFFLFVFLLSSCANSRIKEHDEWRHFFTEQGVANGCFILRDNNHESIHFFNKAQTTRRLLPASTFKIFNSLVALETAIAPSDELVIKWDSVHRKPEWDKDMNMREAFEVSCVPYYQEIARRIGPGKMQHYIDTVKYGNMIIGGKIDNFWLNNTLQITADEQTGFLKRLYFAELPFSERSQRIVKSLMLREQTPAYNLYYKTGTGDMGDSTVYWIVGFAERIMNVKEPKGSMNKSDMRYYPYFFAENFVVAKSDATSDWKQVRVDLMRNLLKEYGALPK